jgi:glyoxylase-like metal-dependent hydrolase (beta-lactamase superfamily II)
MIDRLGRKAEINVLQTGAAGSRVRSTVSLVVEGDRRIVIDPGMAPSQDAIRLPLLGLGYEASEVTDVVISHHHPDHTVNVGMFPQARVHDHWAIYQGEVWTSRPAEGYLVSDSVLLWETPGHTPQDLSTLVGTRTGIVVCTHLWWYQAGPPEDPLAVDRVGIHAGRRRVLAVAGLIVPGHGPPFAPSPETPT